MASPDSLEQAVSCYIEGYREDRREYLRFYETTPKSISEAICLATASNKPNSENRHPHQYRIKKNILNEAKRILRRAWELENCKSFAHLHKCISNELKPLKGAGFLYYYDVAVRIGSYLGLEPTQVYLHAGALTGAKNFGLILHKGQTILDPKELPEPLHKLSAFEIEDFLCVMKDGVDLRGTSCNKSGLCGTKKSKSKC